MTARPRSMAAALQFTLLGPVTLIDAEGRAAQALLTQPRRLALLAYLAAATPRGFQRRDVVLSLFWPELDQEHARAALRQALRVIRGVLGDVVQNRGDEEIGLELQRVQCDVDAFDQAIAAERWDDALALYRGALLEGFFISGAPEFERWLDQERGRLVGAAAVAAQRMAEAFEASGDLAAALSGYRRSLQLTPHDERIVRRCIELLDRLGDRAGAAQLYEEFERRLVVDLNVQPAPETKARMAAVRAREVGAPITESATLPATPAFSRSRRARWSVAVAALIALFGLGIVTTARLHSGGPAKRGSAFPSSNAEASDLYAHGGALMEHVSRENDSVAIIRFQRAAALDPASGVIQAEVSRANLLRVLQFARGDSAAYERARVAADRALRLQPSLAEAHSAEANLLWWTPGPKWSSPGRFNHERAIREFKRAITLDPSLGQAHHLLGNIYLHIGLLDQAIEELQKTLAISPRADGALRRVAEARAYQGRYGDALTLLRQTGAESNAALWTSPMAFLLLHTGQIDSAATLVQDYLRAHPEDRGGVITGARAVWFALAGDSAHAAQDIAAAVQKGSGYIHFHHAGYFIAEAHALLHRPDSAVTWLQRVADGGLPCYPLFAGDPFLDAIRNDPAFVAFLREQKAQWERFRATL